MLSVDYSTLEVGFIWYLIMGVVGFVNWFSIPKDGLTELLPNLTAIYWWSLSVNGECVCINMYM